MLLENSSRPIAANSLDKSEPFTAFYRITSLFVAIKTEEPLSSTMQSMTPMLCKRKSHFSSILVPIFVTCSLGHPRLELTTKGTDIAAERHFHFRAMNV